MNQAQRDYLDRVLNKGSGPSIYDEEDDLGKSSLNEAQKQRLAQMLAARSDSKEAPEGFWKGLGNTLARGSINLYNLTNVSRAEQLSELARAKEAKEARDAKLAAEGGERSLSSKIFDWSSDNETVEELDALAAKYVKRAYDVNKWKNELFPMTEAAEQQLNNIIESDTWFGKEGAILQALSDPLATSSAMLQVAGEQMPTIAAVMLAARKSPKAAMAIMGGSSFLQERYGQLVSEAQEAGYDLSDPNQALEAVKDTKFMSDQSKKGFTRGAIIAATDLAFLGLASKAKFNLGGIATQTGVQAIGGGTGEFLAQVATGDEIRPGEILVEGLAEGAMAPADVAAFGLKKASDMRSGGTPPPANSETRLDGDLAQELVEEEAQLQAANLAEQQKAEVIQQETDDVVKEARLEAAKSFTPRDTFLNERKKAREADAVNPETEVGKAFKQYKKDLGEYGGSPDADKALLTKFMKSFVPKDDREAGIEEYNAALDAHAAGIANGTIIPVSNYDKKTKQAKPETPKKIASDLVAKNSELLTMSEERMRFLIPDEDTYSEVVKLRDKNKPKPETDLIAEQRSYVEEKLGKDWDSKEENAGLATAFNARTGFYKKDKAGRTSFQNKVDAEIAAREEAAKPKEEVLSPEDKAGSTAIAVNESTEVGGLARTLGELKLSPNEQKIANTLLEASRDGTLDTLIDSKGKPIHKALRERAGLKTKQANNTALNRLMDKLAKNFGVTKAAMKERLNETKFRDAQGNVRAEDTGPENFNDASQKLDVADLTDGMGTVGGAGSAQAKDASSNKQTEARKKEIAGYKKLGMTDDQINQFYAKQEDDSSQITQENMQKAENSALKDLENIPVSIITDAAAQWNSDRAKETKPFGSLSPIDQRDWVIAVREYDTSNQEAEDKQELNDALEILEAQERAQLDTAIEDKTNEDNTDRQDQDGPTTGQDSQKDGQGEAAKPDSEPSSRTETSPVEKGDPDSFNAVEDKSGGVEVVKKRKKKFGISQKILDAFNVTSWDAAYDLTIIPERLKNAEAKRKRKNFEETIKQLTGKSESWRIKIYDTFEDAVAARLKGELTEDVPAEAYAWTVPDSKDTPVVLIILDRIPEGREQGVFMHEVGGHMGIDNLIPLKMQQQIALTINTWASFKDNSIESIIANRVLSRLKTAREVINTKLEGQETNPFDDQGYAASETIAYFLEEATFAGVEPSVKAPVGRLLRKLYAHFRNAIRKLRINSDQVTAQDIVDLGYGAARISLSARKHGTASWFARFNHKFMGTGEGAQAYGWGSYLAERFGIARFYMVKDMIQKQELIDFKNDQQNIKDPSTLQLNELPESVQEVILNPSKWGVDLTQFKPSFIDTEPVMGVELDPEVIEKEGLRKIRLDYDPKIKDFRISYPQSAKLTRAYGWASKPIKQDRQGRTLKLRAIIRDHIAGIKRGPNFYFSSPQALIEENDRRAGITAGIPTPPDLTTIDPKYTQLLQDVDSLEALISKKVEEFRAANEATGSIMHIDTTVTNEELLPWDIAISNNRQVRNAIVKKLISLKSQSNRVVADILANIAGMSASESKIITRYIETQRDLKRAISREENQRKEALLQELDMRYGVDEEQSLDYTEEELLAAITGSAIPSNQIKETSTILRLRLNSIASDITNDVIEKFVDDNVGGTLYGALSKFTAEKMRDSPDTMDRFYEEAPDPHRFEESDNYNNSRADKLASMWLDSIGVKGIIYADNVARAQDNIEGMSKNVVIFNDKNLIVLGRSYSQDMKLDRSRTTGKLKRSGLLGPLGSKRPDFVKTDLTKIKYGIADDWVEATLGKTTRQAWVDTKEIARKSAASVEFLHQVIRRVKDKVPSLGKWYEGMLAVEATRTEIRKSFESIALRAKNLKGDRLYLVNDFLSKSTFFQKWGYDPEIEGREVKVDPIMARAFARLSTEEQQIVKDVFAHGEKMRLRKIDIAKLAGVEGKFFTDAALQGPYAPLKRFGNYVTVLKSEAMFQAELAKDAEGATKEDRKLYDKLSQDPQHYVVSFFDTLGQAQEFANANPQFRYRSPTEKIPAADEGRIANTQVFEKVLGALNAGENSGIDSTARQAFGKMVRDLYFQSLDERSARLSGAKRLNRAGYDKNMMRSFLSHAKAEANLIAQMENAANINKAFIEAGKETAIEGNVRGSEENNAYVLVAKHYKQILKGDESPILDRIAAANSVYMLLTSFGYHVANATQPIMVTITRVAGDFNNYAGAWKGLTKGYGIAMKIVKMSNMETSVNVENAPPEYQKLFKKMGLWQILDVGMEEDLSRFESFNTGYNLLNLAGDGLGTITHKLYQVSRYVEAVNRISAAVSAYDMARKDPSKVRAMNMTAEEYAVAVVEDTQGNFSRLDAPLLIKSLPGAKVITQYRKYQLLMAWHYSSAFKQAFKGESAHARAAGKRVLLYSLAHAGIFAGSVGMPLSSLIFWLSTFLGVGEGDEPEDLERWIKRNIDDGAFGQFLSRGVFGFVGIDLSTKLTQDKIFHPLPYVDFQAGEAGWKELLSGIVGPAGTTTGNFFRAWEYMKQGDGIKTLEYIVPKGVRTMLESYRLATEGYTMRNGDVVVDPREISNWSLFWNALGIPSSEIQNIKWTRGQQYELEQYFSNESGSIRRRYIEAHKARDGAWKAELRNEWRELQRAKDRVRPFFNNAPGVLNKQPLKDLIRAPREQKRREKKTQRRFGN